MDVIGAGWIELSERHADKHPQVQSAIEARLGSDLAIHKGSQEERNMT